MKGANKMYEVIAHNKIGTITYDEYYMEKDYARVAFNAAMKCVDCANVDLIDATTGEVLLSWEWIKGITWID